VGVGDDEGDPGQPPGHQAPQERHPAGTVLGRDHVDAEHLPVAVGVDAGGDHRGHRHHPATLSDLVEQGVQPDIGVGPGVEGPVAELGHLLVEVLRQLGDLGLGHAVDAHGMITTAFTTSALMIVSPRRNVAPTNAANRINSR
jgi:hypothetical protein